MFCFKCGNELKDDALFCTSCGAPTVNNLQALTEFEKNKNTAVEKAAKQEVKTAESEKPAEQEAKTAESEKAAKQSTENDSAETDAAESSKASSEVKNESAEQARK